MSSPGVSESILNWFKVLYALLLTSAKTKSNLLSVFNSDMYARISSTIADTEVLLLNERLSCCEVRTNVYTLFLSPYTILYEPMVTSLLYTACLFGLLASLSCFIAPSIAAINSL